MLKLRPIPSFLSPIIATLIVAIILLTSLFLAPSSALANDKNKEYLAQRIKAAFILNIARYVQWPNGMANSELNLCLYQINSLGAASRTIASKKVRKKPLTIKIIDSFDNKQNCQILFLSQEQMKQLIADFKGLSADEQQQQYPLLFSEGLLSIADKSQTNSFERNIEPSLLISLIRQNKRLGIEIDLSTLERSKLKLSSELLKLSKRK